MFADLHEGVAELFEEAAGFGTRRFPEGLSFQPSKTPSTSWAWAPQHNALIIAQKPAVWRPTRIFISLKARDWPWDLRRRAAKNERRRRIDAELKARRPRYLIIPTEPFFIPNRRALPEIDWEFIGQYANQFCSPTKPTKPHASIG